MKNPHLVTQALMVVLIGAVCWMGYQVGHLSAPAAPGAPVQPSAPTRLEAEAVRYRAGLGGSFASLRSGVSLVQVTTKQQAMDELAKARKPLGDALNATFDARCDKDGTITDPAGLAADLGRAAKALGAK